MSSVAIDNLMEDAATAEISRSQIWQWIRYGTVTEEGTTITQAVVESLLQEELRAMERSGFDRFDEAAEIVRMVALEEDFPTVLTIPAYAQYLV